MTSPPESGGPAFRESWFEKRDSESPDSEGPLSQRGPVRVEGDPRSAVLLGALGGSIGGIVMVQVATALARKLAKASDIIPIVGRILPRSVVGDAAYASGLVFSAVVGAVMGALFGILTRHLLRVWARILAGAILFPVLWIVVQAFVLRRMAPPFSTLPFTPMLVGAVSYGACLGIARPRRKNTELDDYM